MFHSVSYRATTERHEQTVEIVFLSSFSPVVARKSVDLKWKLFFSGGGDDFASLSEEVEGEEVVGVFNDSFATSRE